MISSPAGKRWTAPVAGAVLLLLILGVVQADVLQHVIGKWSQWSEFYSHGYLALLLGVYIIYHERERLSVLAPAPAPGGIAVALAAVLAWVVAELAGILLLETLAVFFMLVAIVYAMLGGAVTRVFLVPFSLLLFSLPVWSPLPAVLQVFTADVVYAMVRMIGLPAFREGQFILLPAGSLEVEESCSGMSYLLAAITLGIFYSWLYYRRITRRLLVIAITAVAALAANILRVFIVVYVAYRTNMQHSLISDHFYLGWYLFGGLALVLMLLDTLMLRRRQGGGGVQLARTPEPGSTVPAGPVPIVAATLSMAAIFAGGPAYVDYLERTSGALAPVAVQLPAGTDGWEGPKRSEESWEPLYRGAVPVKSDYVKGAADVTVFLGVYPRQVQGSELVYYSNRIADPAAWRIARQRGVTATRGGLELHEYLLESGAGRQQLVWSWYRVGGHNSVSRFRVKFYQLAGLLTGNTRATLVALATEIRGDEAAAREHLADFLAVMETQLLAVADGTGN